MRRLLVLTGIAAAFPVFGQERLNGPRPESPAELPVTRQLAKRTPSLAALSEAIRREHPLAKGTSQCDQHGGAVGFLDLQGCPVDDRMCEDIAQVHSPVELNLVCTWITDDGLKPLSRLPALRELDLRGTRISDDGVADLARINSLRVVDVRGTKMTQAGVDRLRADRPELVVLCATGSNGP